MLDYPQKHLSFSELCEMINEFSEADWIRLNKIAGLMATKCGMTEKAILQEALTRAFEGRRRCPRAIKGIKFLAETMRSIASSDAKSFNRHPKFSLQTTKFEDGHDYEAELEETTPSMTEAGMIAKIDLARIREKIPPLFESDSEPIQLLVEGILEGMDAGELQELSGLYGKEYNSARRLFRRRIEKAFPGGWSNA
jgi:RNA polymerase sigma-70 factor (ECF subfamily)